MPKRSKTSRSKKLADGHMGVINSLVLKVAGITEKTADPAGGVIYRLNGGQKPSGLLRDNAMDLVGGLIPAPSESAIAEAVSAALKEAAQNGVTSVQDMEGSDDATRRKLFRLYQQLAGSGQLTTRIDMRWPLAEWKRLASPETNRRLRAEYGGLALQFAELAGCREAWEKLLEDWNMEPLEKGSRKRWVRWVANGFSAGILLAAGTAALAYLGLDLFSQLTVASESPLVFDSPSRTVARVQRGGEVIFFDDWNYTDDVGQGDDKNKNGDKDKGKGPPPGKGPPSRHD